MLQPEQEDLQSLNAKHKDLQSLKAKLEEEIKDIEAQIQRVNILFICQQMRQDQSQALWVLPREYEDIAKVIKTETKDEGYVDLSSYWGGDDAVDVRLGNRWVYEREKEYAESTELITEVWNARGRFYDIDDASDISWDHELVEEGLCEDFSDYKLNYLTPNGLGTKKAYEEATMIAFNKCGWPGCWKPRDADRDGFNSPYEVGLVISTIPFVFARKALCQAWIQRQIDEPSES